MGDITPPPLLGPSSKERKYDRQLRLWAANGQAALEESHILLINSGAGVVGIETLKNLVLPGIGQFTILDSALVTEQDLGANFFLEDKDLGSFRGERCCHWLQELNPDVQGHHITDSVKTFISKRHCFVPYTLVLVTFPIAPEILKIIPGAGDKYDIPIFYIHSIGFYSHFTVQLPTTFPIADTHPDPSTTADLRLLKPWPELIEYSKEKTLNMDQMDDEQHGHIPYVLLLLRFLEEWKSSHDGHPPRNYKEKSEFRVMVKRGARTHTAEGGEENFDEAAAAVLRSLNPPLPSDAVKEVFKAVDYYELTKHSSNFWIIAHAIHDFVEEHGVLPVSGGLPDMKSKSSDYVELQNVYKSKARKDAAEVMTRAQDLKRSTKQAETIDQAEIEAFCKNAAYIKLIRGRSPHLVQPALEIRWIDRAGFAANALQDADSLILIHIAILAYDYVLADETKLAAMESKRIPTPLNLADEMMRKAHILIKELIEEAGKAVDDPEYAGVKEKASEIITELVRADGGELHNVSAITGGMVAQEVIKAITKQYIPIDNTCIYDGVLSKTSVIRL